MTLTSAKRSGRCSCGDGDCQTCFPKIKLYWAFSRDHGFQVVFANHPVVGKLFMGITMADARKVAADCDWFN